MGAELRPTPKAVDKPSDPKVRALSLYPTAPAHNRAPAARAALAVGRADPNAFARSMLKKLLLTMTFLSILD